MTQMKRIAISADDTAGLDAVVSPHFGRCPYYVLVDLVDREVRRVSVIENPFYAGHVPGAVPGFIRDQGVNVMLTGGMGRRAIGFFEQYNIEAVTGAAGTVRQALTYYLQGALIGAAPCRESELHAHEEEEPIAIGYEQDEVGRLREEAEMLKQQLGQVTERLERLGSN